MSQSDNNLSSQSNPITSKMGDNLDVNPLSLDSKQDIGILESINGNTRILYITLSIIAFLLLLWIIIVAFTKEDPIKVLKEMTDIATQLQPVTDIYQLPQTNSQPPNINTIFI